MIRQWMHDVVHLLACLCLFQSASIKNFEAPFYNTNLLDIKTGPFHSNQIYSLDGHVKFRIEKEWRQV